MRPRRSSKRAKAKTLVNWLDLPRDVPIQILIRIGTIDLLYNAQRVCSSWRAIAKDPQLYRVIDLRDPWRYIDIDSSVHSERVESVVKLARCAIDRSLGQSVEFSIGYFCSNEIMYDLMNKAPRLKCLRITNATSYVSDRCAVEVIPKLTLLEELDFSFCRFCWCSDELIEAMGFSCRKLKLFGLNVPPFSLSAWGKVMEHELNDKAFAIVDNLNPGLQSLSLLRNSMNNDGLEAILERFTQLEYLDLRQCINLDLKGDLLKKCQAIKTLRLPDDSTDDFLLEHDYDLDGDFACNYFGWDMGDGDGDGDGDLD